MFGLGGGFLVQKVKVHPLRYYKTKNLSVEKENVKQDESVSLNFLKGRQVASALPRRLHYTGTGRHCGKKLKICG